MAFKFNKTQSQTNAPGVVMALEWLINGKREHPEYVVPRLSRTKSGCSLAMLGVASRVWAVQYYRRSFHSAKR